MAKRRKIAAVCRQRAAQNVIITTQEQPWRPILMMQPQRRNAMKNDTALAERCSPSVALTADPDEVLLAAAKQVIASWESGDLAAAVRQLSAAIAFCEREG